MLKIQKLFDNLPQQFEPLVAAYTMCIKPITKNNSVEELCRDNEYISQD